MKFGSSSWFLALMKFLLPRERRLTAGYDLKQNAPLLHQGRLVPTGVKTYASRRGTLSLRPSSILTKAWSWCVEGRDKRPVAIEVISLAQMKKLLSQIRKSLVGERVVQAVFGYPIADGDEANGVGGFGSTGK